MTDDIVDHLRHAESYLPSEGLSAASCMVAEAADEIERLRQWQAEAVNVIDGWDRTWVAAGKPGKLGRPKSEGVLAEIERLRDALAVTESALEAAVDELDQSARQLRAEVGAVASRAKRRESAQAAHIAGLMRTIDKMKEQVANDDAYAVKLRAHAAVLTEKLAQAWRERDHAEGQRKFRAELAYLMVCERDDLAARLQPILDAWTVEGPMRAIHRGAQQNLRRTWPTLAAALDNATRTSTQRTGSTGQAGVGTEPDNLPGDALAGPAPATKGEA